MPLSLITLNAPISDVLATCVPEGVEGVEGEGVDGGDFTHTHTHIDGPPRNLLQPLSPLSQSAPLPTSAQLHADPRHTCAPLPTSAQLHADPRHVHDPDLVVVLLPKHRRGAGGLGHGEIHDARLWSKCGTDVATQV